jgi:hypothetical protein
MMNDGTTPAASGDKSDVFDSSLVAELRIVKEVLGIQNMSIKGIISNITDLNKLFQKIPGFNKTLPEPVKTAFEGFAKLGQIVPNAIEEFMEFEQVAFKTFDQFGVGSENVGMLKERLFEAGQELISFSKTQMDPLEAFKKAASIQEAYSKSLARNVFISKENIVEIGKASELTNVSTDNLIKGFVGAGRSVNNIGEQMETVAKTVVGMGVNVAGVSDNIVNYIGKLDLYNFKGGIEGLARMTAESTKLGINMESVFKKMDEVMDPDKAIEFSNSLSQLGFAASELSDPIRVMFLAENDPEAFAQEIGKLTESMFQFNKETGEVDFLKGNRRMLKQLSDLTGQSEAELMKVGKRMKEAAMISEEIKFAPYSEEDKKLIEGLAKYKEGEGFVVEFADKDGKKVEKNIMSLSDDDLKNLSDSMTIKNQEEAIKKQMSSNELTNSLLYTADASLLQLVVLTEAGNKLSADYRKSGAGGDIDKFRDAMKTNDEIVKLRQAGTLEQIGEAVKNVGTKGAGGVSAVVEGLMEKKADDFVYRSDGSILRFDEGDLVMGIKESFLKGTPSTDMSPLNEMEDRFAALKDQVKPEVRVPISGEISLNLNVTSDKEISKEKLEEILFSTTTVQNLKSKINEAVSNFNLTV